MSSGFWLFGGRGGRKDDAAVAESEAEADKDYDTPMTMSSSVDTPADRGWSFVNHSDVVRCSSVPYALRLYVLMCVV